MDELVLSKSLS
jgi:hypothetical protein